MSINDAIEILEKAIEAQKDNRDMLQALTKAVKALQICRDTKMKQQPRKVATRYARKEFYCPASTEIKAGIHFAMYVVKKLIGDKDTEGRKKDAEV